MYILINLIAPLKRDPHDTVSTVIQHLQMHNFVLIIFI